MDNINKTSYTTDELNNFDFDISDDKIFSNLKNDDCHDFLKIFSILNIEKINTKDKAYVLINHLTNQPNPIREAVALKLEEVINENNISLYLDEFCLEKLSNAIIDINPNVCRAICTILGKNSILSKNICKIIINKTQKLINSIKEFEKENNDFFDKTIRNTKNHAKNKKLFSLYWLLEALAICYCEKYNSEVLEILKYTINFTDYTIREKTAQLLTIIDNPPLELLKIAKSDENFYVKNQVYDKINFEE